MSLFGITAGLSQSTTLPQQIPALVQFGLEYAQPSVLLVATDLPALQPPAQILLLGDKRVDPRQGFVVLCHGFQCAR